MSMRWLAVRGVRHIVVGCALALGAAVAGVSNAQTVVVRTRPLTPQELTNAGLTNTTQLASGVPNVGIGQPLYLEALVTTNTPVTNVTWSFLFKPTNSVATFQSSPLLTNVVLSYDGGDRAAFNIAGRAVLVPDVIRKGTAVTNYDFVVRVALSLTNKVIYATNTLYGSVFMGVDPDGLCVICHDSSSGIAGSPKFSGWSRTGHATAFKRKINGEAGSGFKSTCVSCHVLGYDTTAGATNGGFDDVASQVGWTFPTNLATAAATNNWDAMPLALQNKANIQCESCHGPADRHMVNQDPKAIGVSLSAGNCGVCHDKMTKHTRNYEWNQTKHATGYVFRASGSCAPCHSARGFIATFDPDWVALLSTNHTQHTHVLGTANEGITCVACHDPHSPGMGDYQLRVFTNVVMPGLNGGYTNTVGGQGLLCMQCHKDRYVAETNVTSNARQTPHHGTQGDMLLGRNAIEYGMQMPSSRHLNVLEDSCVECHMQETPTNGMAVVAKNKVGVHTFSLSWTDPTGTTNVDLTETCVKCHGEIEDFDFGGEDYDRDGVVEGVQSEIQGLLNSVAMLLPYPDTNGVYGTTNMPAPKSYWSLSQRRAAWNYLYVWEDRSLGVHNPKYAAAILQASVDDLKGGIDVDRDGLLDSWEVANWGSITAQTGSGDADGDGVSNAMEMAAGTNPKSGDSDSDGISDLAELQGGSNPLSAASKPATNSVAMLPAIELAYLPGTMGVTQQFQSVDALSGAWTNIGSPFVSSNAWFYQLQSTRTATQRFYRVITK